MVNSKVFFKLKQVVNQNNLVTVCQETNVRTLQNAGAKKHATFMIMGDTCTEHALFVM